jgi:hypothetical protein
MPRLSHHRSPRITASPKKRAKHFVFGRKTLLTSREVAADCAHPTDIAKLTSLSFLPEDIADAMERVLAATYCR